MIQFIPSINVMKNKGRGTTIDERDMSTNYNTWILKTTIELIQIDTNA